MDAWNQIARTALVGTERMAFAPPPCPEGVGALVDAAAKATPEDALLASAAVLGTWRAAGMRPAPAPTAEPVAPAEGEDLPTARRSSAYVLMRIVEEAPACVAESLRILAARGLLVPPEMLPTLFDLAARSRDLRPAVAAVMGKRGVALARMRSDWEFMLGSARGLDASSWDGDRQVRAAYLRELRAVDPAKARDLVRECWKGEPAAARRDFLATFEVGLGPEDEEFLESCLDDRSKEARGVAADLLARLPQSAFVARMAERAGAVLRFEDAEGTSGGGLLSRLADKARAALGASSARKFDIEPPTEADAAAKRDGLDPTPAKNDAQGRGARGRMLVAIAAAAPLEVWTRETGRNPEEMIAAARATDWSGELEEGWLSAAVAQQDVAWGLALHQSPRKGRNENADYGRALLALPPAERERLLAESVQKSPRSAPVLLAGFDAPLNPDLTRAIAEPLRRLLEHENPNWDYAMSTFFRYLCERGSPQCCAELVACARAHDRAGMSYAKMLDDGFHIYQLRHEFDRETAP